MKRHLTAAVFLPIYLAIVILGPPWALALLVAAAAALAVLEMARLAEHSGLSVQRGTALVLAVAASFLFLLQEHVAEAFLILALSACGLAVLGGVRLGAHPGKALASAASTLFVVFYPGILMSFLVGLRVAEGDLGRQLLLFVMAVIWMSDAGAFYFGKVLGRHKLCPRISPNKTVEGAIAGLVVAALTAMVWRRLFLPEIGLLAPAVGVALAVVGILGDLGESVMKRGAAIKDSAAVLPGHGGILDRVDSLLLTAPLFYYVYPWVLA
jgi:phosphatidate cytidylyltransferase